ncbi:MAG: ABC transporter permease subunit [Oscillospiraceae bacterium]|jgi:putative aldouronate transport system permease protein|nr:ABC transporter permease subunit [Oscillospiraceae bacterium]
MFINGTVRQPRARSRLQRAWLTCIKQRWLLLMIVPAVATLVLFHYYPIYGLQIAFKNYNMGLGIWGSKWVGFKWFTSFLKSPYAPRLLRNTLLLGLYSLMWSFPLPIIFSIMVNELRSNKLKRSVQTISYLPHFISSVVVVGLVKELFASDGIVNAALTKAFHITPIMFFTMPSMFRSLFIGSGIWQEMGWSSIIFLAALTNVDVELYEAAYIDGATRWQRIKFITFPSILPTVTILLILNVGKMLSMDFQKVLLMYNEQIYETADIISTYTYREGIDRMRYSYSAAVDLFMSVVSFVFLIMTNTIVKRLSDNASSLW